MSTLFDTQIVNELKEIMGDDISMLLDTYLEDSESKLIELTEAVEAQNTDAIRRIAHSLKGSSKNIGAFALANHCEEMEHQARDQVVDNLNVLLADVQEFFNQTKAKLYSQF